MIQRTIGLRARRIPIWRKDHSVFKALSPEVAKMAIGLVVVTRLVRGNCYNHVTQFRKLLNSHSLKAMRLHIKTVNTFRWGSEKRGRQFALSGLKYRTYCRIHLWRPYLLARSNPTPLTAPHPPCLPPLFVAPLLSKPSDDIESKPQECLRSNRNLHTAFKTCHEKLDLGFDSKHPLHLNQSLTPN